MVKISLLSLIPRDKFERLVSKHGSDKHQKGISSWTHLVAMLFCHIGGAASVRDISNGLTSTTRNLSRLGIDRVPCKSSISYINKIRTPELFKAVYFMLLEHLSGTHKFSFVGTSKNAVLIQIWTAMIAMLLLKYLKEKAAYDWHLSNLVTFIRLNLFVKIELMKWLNNPFYKPTRHAERGQLRIGYG